MSFRHLLSVNNLLLVPALVFGSSFGGAALAAGTITNVPPVQTYADQVLPTPVPMSSSRYDSPLAAGTLTLQDVLEAHRTTPKQESKLPVAGGTPSATATAPILTPPVKSSTTGLMLSQGMKAVLQKVGTPSPVAPATLRAPVGAVAAQPQVLLQEPSPAAVVSTPAIDSSGIKYEPGLGPKDLATGAPVALAPTGSVPAETVPAASEDKAACAQNVQKWEKSCGEAGYPSTYVGKISGETRTGCADGALHDVWVTNTCAPSEAAVSPVAKTNGVCGAASNNEFDETPSGNLCGQGVASSVSGEGPWTWACSGVNGGSAAACTAQKRVPAVNGACGSANGAAVSSAPSANLCSLGSASAISGSGPWTWSCRGAGKGHSESCIAPMLSAAPVVEAPVVAPAPAPVHVTAHHAEVAPAGEAEAKPVVAPTPSIPAPVGDKGELCGMASETLAYEAPEKDLCRVGTPSVVNGDGPWSWSCTSNEGVTSSCRTLSLKDDAAAEPSTPQAAPQEAVAESYAAAPRLQKPSMLAKHKATPVVQDTTGPSCGLAASQPSQLAPVSELCQSGKASAVRGPNPWRWSCAKGKSKVACETPRSVDAACGAANGAALKSAPFSGLCASGSPSGIHGDGPWSWTCSGAGGGVDVTCAASVQPKEDKVDGSCGTADGSNVNEAPSANLCSTGAASAVSGTGPWTWSCSGVNGGAVGSCSASKIVPPKAPGIAVNGLCGSANGVTSSVQPSEGLCVSGTLSGIVGNGPWNWSCLGENGGMTVSCTAPLEPPAPIDGACGAANGVPTLVRPRSGLCDAGLTGSVNGRGPWTWTCSGANGGTPASCIAPIAGKSGSIPSVMTPAVDGAVVVPSEPAALATPSLATPSLAPSTTEASSGLTTPQLASSERLPKLDKKVIPSLVPSKAFKSAPKPSRVPAAADVTGDVAPASVPSLAAGSEALPPPALRDNLPSAAVLQEGQSPASRIPGNRLTLDPTISTVLFSRGSGNIEPNVLNTLDKLVIVLQNNADTRISLLAYADNNGSTPREARRLSLSRALAIRGYLSSKGISESRIDVHAEGANTTSGYIDRVDVKVND